jgi:hypothetical protein
MAKRFVVPFAATGDKTVTPDATDPAGAISYSQGWGSQYQLPDTDPSYRPVGRQEMNGVLNDITGAIAELQTLGFPEWVAVTGLVTPYAINAWVRRLGLVYVNTVTNNSAAPESVGSGWAEFSTLVTGRRIGTRVVSASGTFAPTVGAKFFRVRLQGAGGGGGGCPATGAGQGACAGGGGGGAYCESWLTAAQVGAGIAVTIGTGGTGGTGVSGNAGSASSVGALLTAPGGSGGNVTGVLTSSVAALSYGGNGGALASGGNVINTNGITGFFGYQINGTVGGAGGGAPISGGGGGGGSNVAATFVGADGSSPGAGGAGTVSTQSQGAKVGGRGANGVCIVDEYF